MSNKGCENLDYEICYSTSWYPLHEFVPSEKMETSEKLWHLLLSFGLLLILCSFMRILTSRNPLHCNDASRFPTNHEGLLFNDVNVRCEAIFALLLLVCFWKIRIQTRIFLLGYIHTVIGNWSSNWDWRYIWHSFSFSDDGTCELNVVLQKVNIKHAIAKKIREATGPF